MTASNFTLFLSVLHFALASAVTVHALLTRITPPSQIGWIGLAWLSPYIGPLLYFLFGVNRVRRKAIKLTGPGEDVDAPPSRFIVPAEQIGDGHDEHLEPLAKFGLRITGRPLLSGNVLTPLVDGDSAYPEMVRAIDAAQTSVALCSFIFHDDEGGGPIIDALIAAHGRGIAVRVLVDGLGSGYVRSPAYERLRAAGVPAARFMHEVAPWKMSFVNLRSHKKVLVIDGRHGFTGGMNIAAVNLFRQIAVPAREAVQDVHFRIEGPVVAHLMETFAEDWAFTTKEVLGGPDWFPAVEAPGSVPARGIASGPDEDNEKLMWTMAAAIARAESRIRILTPYFLPDDRINSQLILAALRGVTVELIIPGQSNHFYMDWAMNASLAPLLRAGCVVRRTAPPFDHSKLMTVDGAWVLFGSANWDARSLRLNFEFNVEAYSKDFATTADAIIDGKCATSEEVTLKALRSRLITTRLRDAAARLATPYL
ncbi:phospholipase D-like domain-containing protein [Kaistia dalseonensis]|uniref:Phospholipase D n=1 Tax=Kaistia dalseonensis TaxID=410840 RepID=A0ABU0H7C9_9HYPH|nr:phospholipase D-like domain-containing protein [Kaistia dalseonensis]MCX5495113.1 phospholipase D-like domain-containing protein [Kaistia dalseonensis]MDQ0437695.1 cardiolipin synthase [Kaistia dalseonensis]